MADDGGEFRPLDRLPGKLFVPRQRGPRKHPCPECFECLWCPDSRCAACRGGCRDRPARRDAETPKG